MRSSAAEPIRDVATLEEVQDADANPTGRSSVATRDAETHAVAGGMFLFALTWFDSCADNDAGQVLEDAKQLEVAEVDIIWHNMYASSDLTTWRKSSSRSIEAILADMAVLAGKRIFKIISLSVSKSSFVAIVVCELKWDDIKEDVLRATR